MRYSLAERLESRRLLSTSFGGIQISGYVDASFTSQTIAAISTDKALEIYTNLSTLAGQMVNADGTPDGSPFQITTFAQQNPIISGLTAMPTSDGNVVFAYSLYNSSTSFSNIYLGEVDSAGNVAIPPAIATQNTNVNATFPSLAIASDGTIGMSFVSSAMVGGANTSIFSRIFDSSLTPTGPEFQLGGASADSSVSFDQRYPTTVFYNGKFVTAWTNDTLNSTFQTTGQAIDGIATTITGTLFGSQSTLVTGDTTNGLGQPFLVPGALDLSLFYAVQNFTSGFTFEGTDIHGGTVQVSSEGLHELTDGLLELCVAPTQLNIGSAPQVPGLAFDPLMLVTGQLDNSTFTFTGSGTRVLTYQFDPINNIFKSVGDDTASQTAGVTDPLATFFPLMSGGNTYPGLILNTNPTPGVANSTQLNLLPFAVTPSTGGGGSNTFTAKSSLTATDGDGTVAKFSIKGKGQGELVQNSDGTFTLQFTGTNGKTNVTEVGRPSPAGNDGKFNIKEMTASDPIGKINVPGVDVSGDIDLMGVGNMNVGSIKDDHVVTLGTTQNAVIKLGQVASTTLTANGSLKSLTATDWAGGSITADSISTLSITGNLDADVTVTSIKKLVVGGIVGGISSSDVRQLRASGSFGTVTVGGLQNANLFAGVDSSVTTLPTTNAAFINSAAFIKSLTVKGASAIFSDADVAATTINSITVAGLQPNNDTPFGVVAEKILKYKQGSTSKKKVTTPQTLDSTGEYSAATV